MSPEPVIGITPIGVVRSSLHDRADAPRQAFGGAPEATLEINSSFLPALHRVGRGTELIVVTWLHQADRSILQTHPMDDERIPLTGVFATRSSDRPNPIGLHRVTVIDVNPPTRVHVDALEAIDGTPILDPQDRNERGPRRVKRLTTTRVAVRERQVGRRCGRPSEKLLVSGKIGRVRGR